MAVSSTSFQPGVASPNRNGNGRKPIPHDVVALARRYTVACIRALGRVVESDYSPAAARVRAAESLLERGWGRAPTAAEMASQLGASDLGLLHFIAVAAAQGDREDANPDVQDAERLDRSLDEVDAEALGGIDLDTPIRLPADPASAEEALLRAIMARDVTPPPVLDGELAVAGLPLFEGNAEAGAP